MAEGRCRLGADGTLGSVSMGQMWVGERAQRNRLRIKLIALVA